MQYPRDTPGFNFNFGSNLEIKRSLDLNLRTSEQILVIGEKIMSMISDFVANMEPHFQRLELAQENAGVDTENLLAKVNELMAKVAELQGGGATPADQEAITAFSERLVKAADKAVANDEKTPPVVPPA